MKNLEKHLKKLHEAEKSRKVCQELYYMPNLDMAYLFVYVDPWVGGTCSGIIACVNENAVRKKILSRCPDAMFLTILSLAKEFPDENYMEIYDNLQEFERGVDIVTRIRKMRAAQNEKEPPKGGGEE